MDRATAARMVSRTPDALAQLMFRAGLPCGGDWSAPPRLFGVVLFDLVRDLGVSADSARSLLRYIGGMSADQLEQVIEREERRYVLLCGREAMPQLVPFGVVQHVDDERGELVRRAGLRLSAVDVRDGYTSVKNRLAERASSREPDPA